MAMVMVLLVGATIVYGVYLDHQLRRVSVTNLSHKMLPGGAENILLVGSTDRCGLKIQSPVFGSCANGVTGVNSDVVMIVHLDPKRHAVSLLSIPRDLFVPNARSNGVGKIDAALAEGPSQLVAVIEEDFAIPINHYVELNFDGFQGIVNALGGIKMYFPEPVYDGNSGLDIAVPGCVSLDGYHALEVVRARHLQYLPPAMHVASTTEWPHDPQSDLSRIRRDHEFLRVLATAVAKKGLSNPITDQALISTLLPQMKVDSTMSLRDMVNLVLDFHGVNAGAAPQFTLPVSVVDSYSFLYRGVNYGSVEIPSEPNGLEVIRSFLGLPPGTDLMTGDRLPAPSAIRVSVSNGSAVSGEATSTARALTGLGFDASVQSDSPSTGPLSETVVTYAGPSSRAAAEQVAGALSGTVILAQGSTTDGAMVTVVTGSNFSVKPPAGSVTASVPESTNQQFGPPTQGTTTLAPYDPRSCSAAKRPST